MKTQPEEMPAAAGTAPSLTIYNDHFAVVRAFVPLDLQPGVNSFRYPEATTHVVEDSVILRDPTGRHSLQILEQNYRNDPVSQGLLLSLFEGQTIPFAQIRTRDNVTVTELVAGRVVRSGYLPGGRNEQPIIEVNGALQFSLPGEPRFPHLGDDTILRPSFNWLLRAEVPGKFTAEIGYVTGGFSWAACYNIVATEHGNTVDIIGWVTITNNSGKTFAEAKIQVMAGDVNRIPATPHLTNNIVRRLRAEDPVVTERSFDEFHLYSLTRPTTLRTGETKQVEFIRVAGAKVLISYQYDGVHAAYRFSGTINLVPAGGFPPHKKVAITLELANSEENHLGLALPAGKLRFYRRDDEGLLQFAGENTVEHTPRNEKICLTTGHAFDLVGEHKQTHFQINKDAQWLDESFEITLRNRKTTPVTITVIEHLFRWTNWTLTAKSDDFQKTDAQTIHCEVMVAPDEERKVTYTVHYTW